MNPPSYIDPTAVAASLDFEWRSHLDHSGSPELKGPLIKLMTGRTTCATISLLAGIVEWAAWRLQSHIDITDMLMHVQAAFAYQVDWRYVDRGEQRERPPEQPPVTSASLALVSFLRRSMDHDRYWHDIYQPVSETYHAAHIVKHIMPREAAKSYGKWLKTVAEQLTEIAPRPSGENPGFDDFESEEAYNEFSIPYRGNPLPPVVLDPNQPYNPDDREALVNDFLGSLDWKANPLLRKPDAMLKLGFEGTPYQLG